MRTVGANSTRKQLIRKEGMKYPIYTTTNTTSDDVGSGFGTNVQLLSRDITTLQRMFPEDAKDVKMLTEMLKDAIDPDPAVPSYPDLGIVIRQLTEFREKRLHRASRRARNLSSDEDSGLSSDELEALERKLAMTESDSASEAEWMSDSEEPSGDESEHEDLDLDIDKPIMVQGYTQKRKLKRIQPALRAAVAPWSSRPWDAAPSHDARSSAATTATSSTQTPVSGVKRSRAVVAVDNVESKRSRRDNAFTADEKPNSSPPKNRTSYFINTLLSPLCTRRR